MGKFLLPLIGLFYWFRKTILKIRGKKEEDIIDQNVVNGKLWEDFCDNLKTAGAALMFSGAPRDPQQQAEGIRYLSRLTRGGLEAFLEYGDPKFPEFRRIVHETIKMGADNPDNHYVNAVISGEYEYVITGKRNSIHYLGFFTQNGSYGTTGGLAPCGVLEHMDMEIEEDGSFEIILSREKRSKNWLKIEEDSTLLMVRQTYLDRQNEKPADLTIKAIDVEGMAGTISPKELSEGLEKANLFVSGAPLLFAKWAKGFQKHSNELPLFDPAISNAAGGDASIFYYHSHWKLEKDQCLVVNTPIPPCDTWNFQLNNYWMESLDYRYFRICINSFTAELNKDGTVTVIISHSDPNHKNWIQTAGHTEGTMCWRWYRPEEDVPDKLDTQVVKIENLKSILNDQA